MLYEYKDVKNVNLYTCLMLDKNGDIVNQLNIVDPLIGGEFNKGSIDIPKTNYNILGKNKLRIEFSIKEPIVFSKVCTITIFNKKVKYLCNDIDVKERHGKVIIETDNYTIL